MTTGVSAVRNSGGCLKCAITKKSGKLSCCARGGAWFKNCGDVGDSKFDHTWIEGIQSCQGFTRSVSAKSSLQVMVHHAKSTIYSLNSTLSRRVTGHKMNIYQDGDSNNSITNLRECAEYTKIIICLCFFILGFN